MPAGTRINAEGLEVPTYVAPLDVRLTDNITIAAVANVRENRKFYARQVGELNALQKAAGAEKEYNTARGLKEVIKHFTQAEKCATLVINMIENGTTTSTKDFPFELAELLDYEFNSLLGDNYFGRTK